LKKRIKKKLAKKVSRHYYLPSIIPHLYSYHSLVKDAKKMHQVSVDGLANSKVVAGIINHMKAQANRGFFDGTKYFTDELDVEFIDRNKKEIKLYFKHKGYKIHLDKIIDDRVYCVSVTW